MRKERLKRFGRLTNLFQVMPPSFDMDGVLVNSGKKVAERVNEILGTSYQSQDVNEWDIVQKWAMLEGWSKVRARELDRKLWSDPNIFLQSPPMPCAHDFMEALHRQGIKPYFVTSRPPEFRPSTLAWVEKEMSWIEESHVCIRKNEEISGALFKARKINELQIGIHIEDSAKQAREILENAPNCLVVLLSYPSEAGQINNKRLIEIPAPKKFSLRFYNLYQLVSNPDFLSECLQRISSASHNVDS